MNFFGSIGIDFKLLIAQVINFVILLIILTKFIYKPMMQRLEKDKEELKSAKEKEQELEEKTSEAKKQSSEILTSSRKKAEEIIKEAQKVAEDIKQEAQEKETKDEKDEKSQKVSSFGMNLEPVAEIFEDADIKKKAGEHFFKKLMVEARQILPKNPETKKFVLEYASPIPPDSWAQLKSFVIRAFGEDAKLEEKENKSLIAGYRLIAGNTAIDENIAYEIKNETREAE